MKKIISFLIFTGAATLANASSLKWSDNSNLSCTCASYGHPKFLLNCEGGYSALTYGESNTCFEAYQNLNKKVATAQEGSCECFQQQDGPVQLVQYSNRTATTIPFTNNPQHLKIIKVCEDARVHFENIGMCSKAD